MEQLRNGTPNISNSSSSSSSSSCSVRNLIEAVAKIRHQKQCATVARIHKAVRQQLQRNIDVEEVVQQLAIATNSGALWRVDNNGVTSYREPPKGSSKEQVRWSQKEAVRWSNKESQARPSGVNHAKYPLADHVPYAVPDASMFQQMADQFPWPMADPKRWPESVPPWNISEPVRQHLGDPITWPVNEPLKRQMNESIAWTSPEQYRLSMQESFPWSVPAETFTWSMAEPWRQTMIEQFKRAENSNVFENMNYRPSLDPSQKTLIADSSQWLNQDGTTKQQKCSMGKETYHMNRSQMNSMNTTHSPNLTPENVSTAQTMEKQHKNAMGVCMIDQDFSDSNKNVSQVNVNLDCRSNWYLDKEIQPHQMMPFPIQEAAIMPDRKDFRNSCASPNNYMAPGFSPSENPNPLQASSDNQQHISSHFYEPGGVAQQSETFPNNLQAEAGNQSYNDHFLGNNSIYCTSRGFRPSAADGANKPSYQSHYDTVAWSNNYVESEEAGSTKVIFESGAVSSEDDFASRESGTRDDEKDSKKSDESKSKSGKDLNLPSEPEEAPGVNPQACRSPMSQPSEKPPDLTIFPNNHSDNECPDSLALEARSPPVLEESLVDRSPADVKSNRSDSDWKVQEDCRNLCDNNQNINSCHHLKSPGSPSDLNKPVLKSSPQPAASSADVCQLKVRTREAPLPILEKLAPLSLKSELNVVTNDATTTSLSEIHKIEADGIGSESLDCKLFTRPDRSETTSGSLKRKLNIFDSITPSAKCSKLREDTTVTASQEKSIDLKHTTHFLEHLKTACETIATLSVGGTCTLAIHAGKKTLSSSSSFTSSLQTPAVTDVHLRGLVDGLTRFFTPTNKRSSRVSQNAVQRSSAIAQSNSEMILSRLRKPPCSPSVGRIKKVAPKPPIISSKSAVVATSTSVVASAVASLSSSSAARKPRREQLIDGLSHFFSAQGKRRTRLNRNAAREEESASTFSSGDVAFRARSQSTSSSCTSQVLDTIPRLRASSANASTSAVSSESLPLINALVRCSSEDCGNKAFNPASLSRLSPLLSPSALARLKTTKWLSITRKQPQPVVLRLSTETSVVSSTFCSSSSKSSMQTSKSSETRVADRNSITSFSRAGEKHSFTAKPGYGNLFQEVQEDHWSNLSKFYSNRPTNEDVSLFRRARENVHQKYASSSESPGSHVNLSSIVFGEFKIDVTYLSDFPLEFSSLPVLYFCEFCLNYFKSLHLLQKHSSVCTCRCPPGNEVYKTSNGFSIYEIDPCTNSLYCENLCSLSRLFVEPELQMVFSSPSHLYYVLARKDRLGSHVLGYFVREKHQGKGPCLLFLFVFPPHRRKGHASLLINFSYQLCRLLNVPGFLKRTYSVPVLSAFQQYWCWSVMEFLQCSWDSKHSLTIKEMSLSLGIATHNITSTLLKLGIIQARMKSRHPFSPNMKAVENSAKNVFKKGKPFARIHLKNIDVQKSLLLSDKVTPAQLSSMVTTVITSDDEADDYMDNDDSGISLHCGPVETSNCSTENKPQLECVPKPEGELLADVPPANPGSPQYSSFNKEETLIGGEAHGEQVEGLKCNIQLPVSSSISPSLPKPLAKDVGEPSLVSGVPTGGTCVPTSTVTLTSIVKKESRSVEVQTDAYESDYSSDDYDDDDDDDDEDEEATALLESGNAEKLSSNPVGRDESTNLKEREARLDDEISSFCEEIRELDETGVVSSYEMSVVENGMSNDKVESILPLCQAQDTNNNLNDKLCDQSLKKRCAGSVDNNYQPSTPRDGESLNRIGQAQHFHSGHKGGSERKVSKDSEENFDNDEETCNLDCGIKISQQSKHHGEQQVPPAILSSVGDAYSYVNQLPSPANSDMRSPSSVSSYPMSNQPPGKTLDLNSDKSISGNQNLVSNNSGYQDKSSSAQHSVTNKYSSECYLSPDVSNVPLSSSPTVYTGLYFNNPLFINQNSPSNAGSNHYNMPTPSPTNSSSRSFGMASPNANNFQAPQNNIQMLDRGCPSAPVLSYGRVACPQPTNENQFAWASIYHPQPAPAGYSFIKFPDQELMQCGIAPIPSMTPLSDSFPSALALGPPNKCLPASSNAQTIKQSSRKCSNKTCKSSVSSNQCSSFRSQSVAPNVTIQPGTNVITNYNVLNMNVTPDYRNHHQSIAYPTPPYIAAANTTFIGQTAKQHINIYQHQPIGFPQQPQHHNGMYAANYNFFNGAIAQQSFSINVNNIMK